MLEVLKLNSVFVVTSAEAQDYKLNMCGTKELYGTITSCSYKRSVVFMLEIKCLF
jgi:hypothetical protein